MRKKVLVAGAYGAVGSHISKLLSKDDDFELVVSGRNKIRAENFANTLNAEWRVMDINEPGSINSNLQEVDLVINCFIDINKPNLYLPEVCIKKGIDYLDLAGIPVDYHHRFLQLDERAREADVTLITALGLNPGIPGIFTSNNLEFFDKIRSVDFFFTLGSRLDDLSILSLQGVGEMLQITPLVWQKENWQKPSQNSLSKYIESYGKKVYFGPSMITPDLMELPKSMGLENFNFWSGIESLWQSIIFWGGIKFGFTKNKQKTAKFLSLLQKIGNKDKFSHDCNLTMVVTGDKKQETWQRTVSICGSETYATAVSPVIVTKQIAEGLISEKGAFWPPQVVNTANFLSKLRHYNLSFFDEMVKVG